MDWTKADDDALVAFTESIDSDDIKIKNQIKKSLLNNRFIIHVLNNEELEKNNSDPSEYYGVNILDYYMIHPTQTNVQNFICYEVSYDDLDRYNSSIKELDIVFYILCEQKNITEKTTGIARHDLLAALIQDWFNFTHEFGPKCKLISDVASVVDTDYACRTLTFRQRTDNNLVKTRTVSGVRTPMLANKSMVYPSEQT